MAIDHQEALGGGLKEEFVNVAEVGGKGFLHGVLGFHRWSRIGGRAEGALFVKNEEGDLGVNGELAGDAGVKYVGKKASFTCQEGE